MNNSADCTIFLAMKRYTIIAFLMIFMVTGIQARDVSKLPEEFPGIGEILGPGTISELDRSISAGEPGINRFFTSAGEKDGGEDGGREEHLPLIPLAQDLKNAAYGIDFSVGVETVYLIPWEEISDSITGLGKGDFSLKIYNILRSVSTLEGIEYYSASRERMRTLFAECWAIRGPENPERIPDPLVGSIPRRDSIFIHQKDLTFGKNISRIDFQNSDSNMRMGIVNLTTMTYMLFPIVGKENMSMQILVVPSREGILFYGLNTVKVLDLPIFYKKMESSFTNRMIALFHWFRGELS